MIMPTKGNIVVRFKLETKISTIETVIAAYTNERLFPQATDDLSRYYILTVPENQETKTIENIKKEYAPLIEAVYTPRPRKLI